MPHLGQGIYLNTVKPALTNLRDALTQDFLVYYYEETESDAETVTYQYRSDNRVYQQTQTKPSVITTEVIHEEANPEGSTSKKRHTASSTRVIPPKTQQMIDNDAFAAIYIKQLNGELKGYLRYPGNDKLYVNNVRTSTENREAVATFIKQKIVSDTHSTRLNTAEMEQYFGLHFKRKIESNLIHHYRANQQALTYRVAAQDVAARDIILKEIETAIQQRAKNAYTALLQQLIEDNKKQPYPIIKKQVARLLEEIKRLQKKDTKNTATLVHVLEAMDALLDPNEHNGVPVTQRFEVLAKSMPGAHSKTLAGFGALMMNLSVLLVTWAVVTTAVLVLFLAINYPFVFTPALFPVYLPQILGILMQVGAIPAAIAAGGTAMISAGFFAASKPTGLSKAMLDVSKAVQQECQPTNTPQATPK